jgi:hypothetical protein
MRNISHDWNFKRLKHRTECVAMGVVRGTQVIRA